VEILRPLDGDRGNTYDGRNPALSITVHETANEGAGADAAAHARLQAGGNVRTASWHWSVDCIRAIQSYGHRVQCWHAGDGDDPDGGNLTSVAVEICVNADGDYRQARANAAALVGALMRLLDVPAERVYQHEHWSGKDCPERLRSSCDGASWAAFVAEAEASKEVTL